MSGDDLETIKDIYAAMEANEVDIAFDKLGRLIEETEIKIEAFGDNET